MGIDRRAAFHSECPMCEYEYADFLAHVYLFSVSTAGLRPSSYCTEIFVFFLNSLVSFNDIDWIIFQFLVFIV